MKNFQQNLFVVLAIALCSLCAFQWYGQTQQRNQMDGLNQVIYQKSAAIRDYTNSIATMSHEVAQMDAEITRLKGTVKTNEQQMAAQRTEINRLEADGEALTNQIAGYKLDLQTLQAKLKDAYDGIKKQDEMLKDLVAQRDEFVQKYNDSVKERNDIVAKYNALVDQVQKAQAGGSK
jgi:chromosome segregation ATPase